MYVRVVRFTGVDSDRMHELRSRAEEGGPPEGVSISRLQVLLDEGQGTAVVIQHFDSEADLQAGERVFDAMDAGDTPGERASVDRGELLLDLEP